MGSVLVHIRTHLRCPHCLRYAAQTQIWTLLFNSDFGHGCRVACDERSFKQRCHCIRLSGVQLGDVAYLRYAVGHRSNGPFSVHWFHANIGHALVGRWDDVPTWSTTPQRSRRSHCCRSCLRWTLCGQPKMCTVFVKLIRYIIVFFPYKHKFPTHYIYIYIHIFCVYHVIQIVCVCGVFSTQVCLYIYMVVVEKCKIRN